MSLNNTPVGNILKSRLQKPAMQIQPGVANDVNKENPVSVSFCHYERHGLVY
jgi:hypothetical protein